MANFNLVADTSFKARGFDELIKPLAMYKEEYDKNMEAFDKMQTEAATIESIANANTDPMAYNQYKRYADELREQANIIAATGLNPNTRNRLSSLRTRYASEIIPIQAASALKKEQVNKQRELKAKDNTIFFDRNADLDSLDNYIGKTDVPYNSYSGASIRDAVSREVAPIAKRLSDVRKGVVSPRKFALDAGTGLYLESKGYSPEEIQNIRTRIENGDTSTINNIVDKMLVDSVNSALVSHGINSSSPRDVYNRGMEFAIEGLSSAIGEENLKQFTTMAGRAPESRKSGQNTKVVTMPGKVDTKTIYFGKDEALGKQREEKRDKIEGYGITYNGGRVSVNDIADKLKRKELTFKDDSTMSFTTPTKLIKNGRFESKDYYDSLSKKEDELNNKINNALDNETYKDVTWGGGNGKIKNMSLREAIDFYKDAIEKYNREVKDQSRYGTDSHSFSEWWKDKSYKGDLNRLQEIIRKKTDVDIRQLEGVVMAKQNYNDILNTLKEVGIDNPWGMSVDEIEDALNSNKSIAKFEDIYNKNNAVGFQVIPLDMHGGSDLANNIKAKEIIKSKAVLIDSGDVEKNEKTGKYSFKTKTSSIGSKKDKWLFDEGAGNDWKQIDEGNYTVSVSLDPDKLGYIIKPVDSDNYYYIPADSIHDRSQYTFNDARPENADYSSLGITDNTGRAVSRYNDVKNELIRRFKNNGYSNEDAVSATNRVLGEYKDIHTYSRLNSLRKLLFGEYKVGVTNVSSNSLSPVDQKYPVYGYDS